MSESEEQKRERWHQEDLRVESFAEGREGGREEQSREMAVNFYKMGIPIERIAKESGFSVETIKEWVTPKAD